MIAQAMKPVEYQKGDTLNAYDHVGNTYYALVKGSVKVNCYEKEIDPNNVKDEDYISTKHV